MNGTEGVRERGGNRKHEKERRREGENKRVCVFEREREEDSLS